MPKLVETRKSTQINEFASECSCFQQPAILENHRSRWNGGRKSEILPRLNINGTFYKQNLEIENQAPIFRWRRSSFLQQPSLKNLWFSVFLSIGAVEIGGTPRSTCGLVNGRNHRQNQKFQPQFSVGAPKLAEIHKSTIQFAGEYSFFRQLSLKNLRLSVLLAIGVVGNPGIHPRPNVNGTFYKQKLVIDNRAPNFRWRHRNWRTTANINEFAGECSLHFPYF